MDILKIRNRFIINGGIFYILIICWILFSLIFLLINKFNPNNLIIRLLNYFLILLNFSASIFFLISLFYLYKICKLLNIKFIKILLILSLTWPFYIFTILYFDNKLKSNNYI